MLLPTLASARDRLLQLQLNNARYDTIHGKYDGTVEVDGDSLVIDGTKAPHRRNLGVLG